MGGAVRKVPKGIYLYLSYTSVIFNSSSKNCNRVLKWKREMVDEDSPGGRDILPPPSHWPPEPKAQCEDRNQPPSRDCPTST